MAEEAALPLRLLPCLRSSPPALMMMTTIITGKKKSPAVPISLTPAMLLLLLLLFSAVSGLAGFFFALEDFTVGTGRGDSLGSAKRAAGLEGGGPHLRETRSPPRQAYTSAGRRRMDEHLQGVCLWVGSSEAILLLPPRAPRTFFFQLGER